MTEEPWVRTGLLLRDITEPDTSIGVFPAGILPYFSERPSVDMLGKNDHVVARRATFPGANRPGHNKFDYGYSLNQHKPDLLMVLFPPSQIIEPGALDRLASGDRAYASQLYLNETFQTHYAANLTFIDAIPFFIQKDSGLQEQLLTEPCELVTREVSCASISKWSAGQILTSNCANDRPPRTLRWVRPGHSDQSRISTETSSPHLGKCRQKSYLIGV